MRKWVSAILAVIILGGGIYLYNVLSNKEKTRRPDEERMAPIAFIEEVENGEVPVTIEESGRLISKNKIQIYSEVQGVMEQTSKVFKPGI